MPEPRQRLLAELVAVAEQLVAAADGEQDGAVVDRRGERLALGLRPCRRRRRAGRGPGRRRCRRGRGRPGRPPRRGRRRRRRSRSLATRSAAAGRRCCRGRRRCSSARGRGRGRGAPSARPSSRTTTEPTWESVGGISRRPTGSSPASRASASIVSALEQAQRDLVELLAQLAGRGDGLAQAADDDRAGVEAGVERQARVDPAVDLAGVGQGRGRLLDQLVGKAVDDRDRDGPPGAQVAARRSAGRRCARRRCRGAGSAASAPAPSRTGPRARTRRASPTSAVAGRPALAARSLKAATRSGSRSRPCIRWPRRARSSATRPVPQPRSRIGPSTAAASSRQSARSPS